MDLKPISRIILQSADGSTFYSVAWDDTADLTLKAGSGRAIVAHSGTTYTFSASSSGATVSSPPPTATPPVVVPPVGSGAPVAAEPPPPAPAAPVTAEPPAPTPATPMPPREPMLLKIGPNQQYPFLPEAMGPVIDAVYSGSRRLALEIQMEVTDALNKNGDPYYTDSTSCHFHGGVWPPFEQNMGIRPGDIDLVMRRIPGSPPGLIKLWVKDTNSIYYGKGILNLLQNNATIDGFHFANNMYGGSSSNSSGLRFDGNPGTGQGDIKLTNCTFENNCDGVLGGLPGQTIAIENCWFKDNGDGTGLTHNAYLNHFDHVALTNVLSTGARTGHLMKIRALKTVIRGLRCFDGDAGTASYSLDFPNGGDIDIDGLVTHKGGNPSNAPMVVFGEEGNTGGPRNPNDSIKIRNWTMINDSGPDSWGGVIGFWQMGNSKPDIQDTQAWNMLDARIFFVGATDAQGNNGGYQAATFQPFPDLGLVKLSARPALDMASPVNMQG